MAKRTICITESDLRRLEELDEYVAMAGDRDIAQMRQLKKELRRAKVLSSKDIPKDRVTINSTVLLMDLDSREETTLTLVYPVNADISQGKISVLAPIGTALLGRKVGEIIERRVPAGLRRLKMKKIIYQPEAAGDYHLKSDQ